MRKENETIPIKTQKQVMYAVQRNHAEAVELFADIQRGPWPLTREEIRKMKALRPGQYDWIPEELWVESDTSNPNEAKREKEAMVIVKQPPIGLEPRPTWLEKRKHQIREAMTRYAAKEMDIPYRWVEELRWVEERIDEVSLERF